MSLQMTSALLSVTLLMSTYYLDIEERDPEPDHDPECDEPIILAEFLFLGNEDEISTLPAQEVMGNKHEHGQRVGSYLHAP